MILEPGKKFQSRHKESLEPFKADTLDRRHNNLESFISTWSIESHTFMVAYGEFGPILEGATAWTMLLIYGDANAMGTRIKVEIY